MVDIKHRFLQVRVFLKLQFKLKEIHAIVKKLIYLHLQNFVVIEILLSFLFN